MKPPGLNRAKCPGCRGKVLSFEDDTNDKNTEVFCAECGWTGDCSAYGKDYSAMWGPAPEGCLEVTDGELV